MSVEGESRESGEFGDVQDHSLRYERCLRLANEPASVKAARDAVAAALQATGWPEHTIDMARVVTSELATNAIIHAGTAFELRVSIDGTAVIAVEDGAGTEAPRLAEKGHSRPGGMGLYLVEAMCAEWGVEQRSDGKVVWARLDRYHSDPGA